MVPLIIDSSTSSRSISSAGTALSGSTRCLRECTPISAAIPSSRAHTSASGQRLVLDGVAGGGTAVSSGAGVSSGSAGPSPSSWASSRSSAARFSADGLNLYHSTLPFSDCLPHTWCICVVSALQLLKKVPLPPPCRRGHSLSYHGGQAKSMSRCAKKLCAQNRNFFLDFPPWVW